MLTGCGASGDVPISRDLPQAPAFAKPISVPDPKEGEPTLAVDTHIFRLGNRLLLAPGRTPEEVEAGFLRIIPEEYLRHAHHWLILHGRYTCKARRPECWRCIVADLCAFEPKTPAPGAG